MRAYKLGVACMDGLMQSPYLMESDKFIVAETYEEAKRKFLADPSVAKAKANDTVMVLEVVA